MLRTGPDFPRGTARPPSGIFHADFLRHIQGIARIPNPSAAGDTIVMSGNARDGAFLYIASGRQNEFARVIQLDGEFPHPGGIQAVGSLVAVGTDNDQGPSLVRFIDVAVPKEPRELHHLNIARSFADAEEVGITRLIDGPMKGRYALVVGASDNTRLTFYLSNQANLESPQTRFEMLAEWKQGPGKKTLPNYQALQFVTQCDGQLFLVGSFKTSFIFGDDYLDVYRLDLPKGKSEIKMTQVLRKHMICNHCSLRAGGGLFIEPTNGDLHFYGTGFWTRKVKGVAVVRYEGFAPGKSDLPRRILSTAQ